MLTVKHRVKDKVRDGRECCSQCLLALFISFSPQGHPIPNSTCLTLIHLCLPSPPTLRAVEKWSSPSSCNTSHDAGTQRTWSISRSFTKEPAGWEGYSGLFRWHKCATSLTMCSTLLFAHALLFYWPVWTILEVLANTVFVFGFREHRLVGGCSILAIKLAVTNVMYRYCHAGWWLLKDTAAADNPSHDGLICQSFLD